MRRTLVRLFRWLAALVDRPARPARTEKVTGHANLQELEKAHFSGPGRVASPGPSADLWWAYDRGWHPTENVTPFTFPQGGNYL